MKQFLIILGITAIVWFGVSISEPHEYPLHVGVDMQGIDTVRYAVVQADTALNLNVEMPGFNAAIISILHRQPRVEVDMSGEGLRRSLSINDLSENLRQQLGWLGASRVTGARDSIRLRLSARGSRRIPIRLDSVDFLFSEQYGLYGEPVVEPGEVILYGDDSLLATIDVAQAARTRIEGISSTATYQLALDPAWSRLGDVHSSVNEVKVHLPVEAFVEREFIVPIEVEGADTTVKIRLYPSEARVRTWVAKRDLQRTPELRVTVNYIEILDGATRQKPCLKQFPAYMRPRHVEPDEVQCLIIK